MPWRKTVSIILCIMLCITSVMSGCSKDKDKKNKDETQNTAVDTRAKINLQVDAGKGIQLPYTPAVYEKNVKPYKVNADLSNVVNLKQFGTFSKEQKEMLSKNAFVVSPGEELQLTYIYERNSYMFLPSFVTADTVLHVYHVLYDYSLRYMESEKLLNPLETLTGSMLQKSIDIYNNVKNAEVKKAALKNAAYFAVANMSLLKENPSNLPAEVKDLAEREYSQIKKKSGVSGSCIFPYDMDFTQYVPRGHYTRSDDLKRFFTTMMWYGQAAFPLYFDVGEKDRNVEQTLQALLITCSLFTEKSGTQDYELWEQIYEPTCLYVGKSDDLTIYDYRDLLVKVYGGSPDIEKLDDPDSLNKFYEECKSLPSPKIKAKVSTVRLPVGKQLRFMGQRYIPDSEIMQELVEPIKRPAPKGLDVFGVLGSDRAYQIIKNEEDDSWPEYKTVFNMLRKKFAATDEKTWHSNMYYGWMYALKDYPDPYGKGYPSFMTNQAWTDKCLSTALGSWAELKHDTILYGKQVMAERGGGELPKVLGYVEPAVETYERLLWLTTYSKENLKSRGLGDEVVPTLEMYENLLKFLINCSVKELRGEALTEGEYYCIYDYGAKLEQLTANFMTDENNGYEITSDADKNMALISDYATIFPTTYMETGVGPAHEIYVVVPIEGKLYLTRGAVFSYYEFPYGKRLTDEDWQKMLKDKNAPAQPSWIRSFIKGGKGRIPEPARPYNS